MINVNYGDLDRNMIEVLNKVLSPTQAHNEGAFLKIDNIPGKFSVAWFAFKPSIPENVKEAVIRKLKEVYESR